MEAENLGKKLAKELARRQVEKQVRKDARESERIMTASRQRNPAIRLDQDDFKRRLGEAFEELRERTPRRPTRVGELPTHLKRRALMV